ncbi:MAG: NADH-quinone oxidoreductase subunit J [Candidatus Rokubacteria bacterium]|nr:NADH-quinone oxidoreductase subunit J [Candidatus Rokubacteria bacterium]MBI3824724.1 NADH-quinone oxidoreductase subunit J [Candidatus Rokubacteria bacterium]
MTLAVAAFWAVAAVLLASSLAVILTPNLFHSVLFLALALAATACVFLMLESPLLFGVQLLLYGLGAVVFAVFAIMLTERLVGQRITQASRWIVNGLIVGAGVAAAVLGFLAGRPAPPAAAPPADAVAGVARALTGPFALPFELLAVLLVAALLGAVYFARAEE